jgi:ABC-type Na+ efflux pump permease subunit
VAAPLIGLGVGVLLGLRFKVLVLIPVTLAAMMLLATAGLNWSNAGWMLLTAIAIQAGYLLGVIAREYAANFPHVDWRSILRWRHNTRL